MGDPAWTDPPLWQLGGLTFLLALMGWMPAPLDIGVWSSLWILEKRRGNERPPSRAQALLDFNVGYGVTAVLAVAFVSFGALVMHGTGVEFSASGLAFSQQLIEMYTGTLGAWTRPVIALVAFITMFSTTLTVLDGYARTMGGGFALLAGRGETARRRLYFVFLVLQIVLAVLIIGFFLGGMKALVDVATVLAFLTAPLVAVLNFKVMNLDTVPAGQRPGPAMVWYCRAGIIFLVGFSLAWIWVRWIR